MYNRGGEGGAGDLSVYASFSTSVLTAIIIFFKNLLGYRYVGTSTEIATIK